MLHLSLILPVPESSVTTVCLSRQYLAHGFLRQLSNSPNWKCTMYKQLFGMFFSRHVLLFCLRVDIWLEPFIGEIKETFQIKYDEICSFNVNS